MENKINLEKLNACKDAVEWFKTQPSNRDAWLNCPRGDWMLWIAAKLKVDERKLILAKGHCAKTVYHLLTDNRSREAIVAAINYGRGLIDKTELHKAYIAATNAACITADDAAANAAFIATATVYTNTPYIDAYNADNAAADAADAAADAAAANANANNANADNASNAARKKNQQKTADICRKYLTSEIEKYF